MFTHPRTPLFVEFPTGPLAIGDELIRVDAWAKREGASKKLEKFKQALAARKRPK